MNHDSPDPQLQYMELHDSIVPNDADTQQEEWLQEPFSVRYHPGAETLVELGPAAETLVEFGPAAETQEVQDVNDEFISWMNYDNEFSRGPYIATPPQLAENEILDYMMTTPPQQAENEVHYDEDSLMEFLHASQQLIEPTTEFILSQPYQLVQGEQQLIQPVTDLPQQAEDAFCLPELPLVESDNMLPSEASLVDPFGFNNNHHYFSAPAVHNSPWAVSPFPSTSAPIYYEPPAETTSVVAAVEGTKEKGSTSNVNEENQVRNTPPEN